MFASLLPGLREVRSAVLSGLVWFAAAWLVWLRHLPGRESAQGLLADAYALAAYLGTSLTLGAIIVAALLAGEIWMYLRESIVIWSREFVRFKVRISRVRERVRRSNPADVAIDHCIGPAGRFVGLFARLGFKRPNELDFLDRDRLARELERDVEALMTGVVGVDPALRSAYDRGIGGAHFIAALAVPSAVFAGALTIASAPGRWVWCAIAGVIVWRLLVAIALLRYRTAFLLIVESANLGEVGLPLLAGLGRRMFGSVPEGYDSYTDGVPTGAVLLEQPSHTD